MSSPPIHSLYRQSSDKQVEVDIIKFLKGIFYIQVFNDPLVRLSLKSYVKWILNLPNDISPTFKQEIFQNYTKINEIENDWHDFISTSRLSEFFTVMLELNIFTRIKNLDGYCFNSNGRCDHENKGCVEWTKPLWFEVMQLHIKQICEFHKQSQELNQNHSLDEGQ